MGLFVDNSIKLKITRDNGTTLFEKTFVKNDFVTDGNIEEFYSANKHFTIK